MSKGKYSPTVYFRKDDKVTFDRNAYGKECEPWDRENYNEATMFGNYDEEGYDSYGYSAFNADGEYVGIGDGVDRNGYTEFDYLAMSDEEFEQHC